jgi:hypothetical protein
MLVDFVLLWSAAIAVVKYGLKGLITPEAGGLILIGVLFFVAITGIAGSNVFRNRGVIPKFIVSLASFALSVADGDIRAAVDVAIWTSALPICLFGLYICFWSTFGRR